MSFINLSDYISQGGILRNLSHSGQFDCVVYEQFVHEGFDMPEGVNLMTLSELAYTTDISGTIAWVAKTHKNVLLILDQIHRSQLMPLVEEFDQAALLSLHIVCLHSGISWLLTGIGLRNTTSAVSFHTAASVSDPYDVPSFFTNLDKSGVHFHMVHDGDYPNNLFANHEEVRSEGSLQSMTGFGFAWHDGTIVCSGRISMEIIGTLQVLQQEGKFYDLFVCDAPFTTITSDLRDSLIKTEKLIIIWDHDEKVAHIFWSTLLYTQWLYETHIQIITPQTEGVNTTQWEYLYEQAWLGREALMEKLG